MKTEEDISGMHLWLVLWKAYKSIECIDKRSISSLGIGGMSDFAILEILLHKGPSPINVIGKTIGLTSGSITAAVDRVEKKGWVNRHVHPSDRRGVNIDLTEAGRELIQNSMEKHAAQLESAAGILDSEERTILIRLLKKLGYHAASINQLPDNQVSETTDLKLSKQ